MNITLLSISHHTAPVALRERLALSDQAVEQVAASWRQTYGGSELVLINTCNRVEWYVACPAQGQPDIEALRQFVGDFCQVDLAELNAASIHRENLQAVEHLFRVACGLESMVLGEPQIIGQIKRAYEHANALSSVGATLHTLFQEALATGKEVRTATGIDTGRISVGSTAVEFARQVFESFDDKTILAVGAGEMAKITLHHLQSLNPRKLWLVNRSIDRARELAAQLNVDGARQIDDLDPLLVEADMLITSTASNEPIITPARFTPLLGRRRNRPLVIIDLAVPRDVDPAVGGLQNVYLYNIDDLQQVVDATQAQRMHEADEARARVRDAADRCMKRIQNHDVGQLVRALRTRLHELGELEQQRTLRKLESASPDEVPRLLEEHTHRLVNKILHLPVSQLDRRQPASVLGFFAAALRKLFRLDSQAAAQDTEEADTQRVHSHRE